MGEKLIFHIVITSNNPNEESIKTAIEIINSEGIKLVNMIDIDSKFQVYCKSGQSKKIEVIIDDIRFIPGRYFVNIYCGDMSSTECYDYVESSVSFEIIDGGTLTNRHLPSHSSLFFLTPKWQTIDL
jgi:hypothetical protein